MLYLGSVSTSGTHSFNYWELQKGLPIGQNSNFISETFRRMKQKLKKGFQMEAWERLVYIYLQTEVRNSVVRRHSWKNNPYEFFMNSKTLYHNLSKEEGKLEVGVPV